MVAEDGGEGDGAGDEELGVFEDGGLGVRRGFPVDLIAGEDDKVRLLAVEDRAYEFEGSWVGVAFAPVVVWGLGVAAET